MQVSIRRLCVGVVALNAIAAVSLVAAWTLYSH